MLDFIVPPVTSLSERFPGDALKLTDHRNTRPKGGDKSRPSDSRHKTSLDL